MKVLKSLRRSMPNIPGWHTNRKIVVIESDDWGSIRMPSKKVYDKLLQDGYNVDQLSYERYDSLASEEDLSALFDTLTSIKNQREQHPVITANTVVANPDFEKIAASGFSEYFYEPFIKTLTQYPHHTHAFALWKEGIEQQIFHPQFHAREHLNVARWMRDLQQNIPAARLAFEHKTISLSSLITPNNKNAYMDSFDYDTEVESILLNTILTDGLQLFESLFGYPSKSFIASCYIWSKELEIKLQKCGVDFIQGMAVQTIPTLNHGNVYTHNYHYTGQKNRLEQIYLVRNCFFEPSENIAFDWVNDCMNRIKIAFRWGKPAIISTHRLNFIGNIDPTNRDRNLKLFANLLKTILHFYPDVEFMTSDQLGSVIASNTKV
ncbi:hypothetical protein [Microbacter margulisiae]|uniref:Polysaccharide (De)acetylase n=1 Tax=Microbacter margulisiae TaxID=1350067 RepID=A0A7W5H0W0_9PORP|nr:hypothetical protein [Microbacter margulisiae]MBB3185989.1 hypothetical protein [Microbacter margulisiae]